MKPNKPDVGKDSYRLEELSELLDTPIEKLKGWIREDNISPVTTDRPDEYDNQAYERLRARRII